MLFPNMVKKRPTFQLWN